MYTFKYMRFTRQYNKYVCWTLLYLMYGIYRKLFMFTLWYETVIKTMFILKFAYTNVPNLRLCY